MNRIYKYPFAVSDAVDVRLPDGAEILHVECQNGEPCIWALIDPARAHHVRRFRVIGTGHDIVSLKGLTFVATFQQPPFVWHLFEVSR
jgi:hypothetical protein